MKTYSAAFEHEAVPYPEQRLETREECNGDRVRKKEKQIEESGEWKREGEHYQMHGHHGVVPEGTFAGLHSCLQKPQGSCNRENMKRFNPLSAKASFQLWYPGGQRLKVISFSWSGVKSPSKCFSNTEPTKIIASRDKKRCNASVQWARSVHSSLLRLSDQHRKCHGWLLFFAFPALQPDRPAAVHSRTP